MHGKGKYILIALAFVMGLTFELMKKSVDHKNPQSIQPKSLTSSELGRLDVTPFHRSEGESTQQQAQQKLRAFKMRGSSQSFQVAKRMQKNQGTPPPSGQHSFSHTLPKGSAKASDKKSKDSKKDSKDKEKKKKEDEKKKKEKEKDKKKDKDKKVKEDKDDDSSEEDEKDEEVADNEGHSPADPGHSLTGGIPLPAEESKKENDLPVSYEDWAELVLYKPHFENTNRLIEYFNTGLVSEEVFFRIMNDMIADDREKMHAMALRMASDTVHPRSFIGLAKILSNGKISSKTQNQARQAADKYASLSFVFQLVNVLASQEADFVAQTLAAELIEQSAVNHLKKALSPQAQNNPENALTPHEIENRIRIFEQIATSVTRLIEGGRITNKALQSTTTAVQNINDLLA